MFSVLALIIPPYLDATCFGTPPDYQDTSISDALEPHLLVTESLLDLLALELFLAVEVFRGTYASPLLCLARDEAVLLSHTGLVGEAPRRESFQLLFPWYGSRSFGLNFIPLLRESCLCSLESCLWRLPVLESCR